MGDGVSDLVRRGEGWASEHQRRQADVEALEKAVDTFAAEMKAKLRSKAADGWTGWSAPTPGRWVNGCFSHLRRMDRGDIGQAVDVANFAMFAWNATRQ